MNNITIERNVSFKACGDKPDRKIETVTNGQWMEMYDCLLSYIDQHNGSTHVPPEIVPLGPWVQLQRCYHNLGILPDNRVALLQKINFARNDAFDTKWMEMYRQLVAYKEKYKSTRVPKLCKDHSELGLWVHHERLSRTKKQHRLYLLNAIGFRWNVRNDNWMEMYERLVAYKKEHNTTSVPERYKEDPQLAFWVHHQRQCCKEKDRISLLNDIGFHWDVRTDNWMELYKRLVAYKEKYKSTCVPRHFKDDPQLGFWVFTQRQCCKAKYRVDLLNDIGFEWISRSKGWSEMYDRLVVFKKEHGTTKVPVSDKRDPKLAMWVHNQKQTCKDKDRVDLLNDLGFEWRLSRADSWMEMFKRLVAYKNEHGTTSIQHSHKGNSQLARWVYHQRQSCIDKDRRDLLYSIEFEWKSGRGRRA